MLLRVEAGGVPVQVQVLWLSDRQTFRAGALPTWCSMWRPASLAACSRAC